MRQQEAVEKINEKPQTNRPLSQEDRSNAKRQLIERQTPIP